MKTKISFYCLGSEGLLSLNHRAKCLIMKFIIYEVDIENEAGRQDLLSMSTVIFNPLKIDSDLQASEEVTAKEQQPVLLSDLRRWFIAEL